MDAMSSTHFGFESVDERDKAQRVRGVFDSVAPRYDLMNDLMSLGLHRAWKAYTVLVANVRPGQQVALIDAGTGALTVSDESNIIDMARLALAFRAANSPEGITGTPPISTIDYRPGGNVGSAVLLDPDAAPAFWTAIRDGSLPPGPVGGMPGA